MFSPPNRSRIAAVFAALALTAAALWWFTLPDPRQAFLNDIADMLEDANAYDHAALLPRLSPEAEELIRTDYTTAATALAWVCRRDAEEGRAYRLAHLTIFHARDYAEVEIERSAAGKTFDGQGRFSVPFLWRDDRWWVAASFRGERDWDFPR